MELLSFGVGEDRERGQAKKQRPKVFRSKGLTRRRSVPFFDSLCSELVPT